MADRKPNYAPVPARALGDERLTGLHLKALAKVALHDRFNKNGQGCWAGVKRMAEETRSNYTNFSTAIADLVRWHYLDKRKHPIDGRLTAFTVLYNDDDQAAVKGAEAMPTGKASAAAAPEIVCPEAKHSGEMLCPETGDAMPGIPATPSTHSGSSLQEKEEIPLSGLKRDTPEGAPRKRDGLPAGNGGDQHHDRDNIGGQLAQLERWLKRNQGQPLNETSIAVLRQHRERLGEVWAECGTEDNIGAWALRLDEEIGYLIGDLE